MNSIHPKAVGGGFGALLSGAVITIIQTYWIKNTLPGQVTALIYVAIPGILAFAGAWLAPERAAPPTATAEEPKSYVVNLPTGPWSGAGETLPVTEASK